MRALALHLPGRLSAAEGKGGESCLREEGINGSFRPVASLGPMGPDPLAFFSEPPHPKPQLLPLAKQLLCVVPSRFSTIAMQTWGPQSPPPIPSYGAGIFGLRGKLFAQVRQQKNKECVYLSTGSCACTWTSSRKPQWCSGWSIGLVYQGSNPMCHETFGVTLGQSSYSA